MVELYINQSLLDYFQQIICFLKHAHTFQAMFKNTNVVFTFAAKRLNTGTYSGSCQIKVLNKHELDCIQY